MLGVIDKKKTSFEVKIDSYYMLQGGKIQLT